MMDVMRNFLCLLFMAVVTGAASLPARAGTSIVVDVGTGAVLSADQAHRRWYPASLTKLMTTYLALRAIKSGGKTILSPVVMSKNAAAEPPSKMGYPPGSVLTLDNAIKIMMVKSANDVSVAVGEAIAGSETGFVKLMNETALRLGMSGTRFANPNGWHSEDQYTTARDMAVLVVALRREFPEHAGYFSMEALKAGKRILETYNVLIGRFAGADGMKTGFVCASGFNLAASATRGGRTLTAIVLGAESPEERAEKAADLLAAGFEMSGSGAPAIERFLPETTPTEATDMRPEVCSKKARSGRARERDENGKMIFRTPHIHPRAGDPHAVVVGLGGAVGELPEVHNYADVPVPTPRPDTGPVIAPEPEAASGKKAGNAAEPDNNGLPGTIVTAIPVPEPRVSAAQ